MAHDESVLKKNPTNTFTIHNFFAKVEVRAKYIINLQRFDVGNYYSN